MKFSISKGIEWAKRHRFAMAFALLAVGIAGWALWPAAPEETRYSVATAEKATIVTTVSGSGQIAASTQVSLKAKTSGEVVYVGAKVGDVVKQGALIVQLNASDAQKAVRDAQISLEGARLSLQKIERAADELTVTQYRNNLARAQENEVGARADLQKAYEDGYTAVSNAFLDLPDIISGLQETLYTISPQLSQNEEPIEFYRGATERFDSRVTEFRDDAAQKYQTARNAYDAAFLLFKSTPRTASSEDIEHLISQSYDAAKDLSDAVRSANNLIQFYKDTLTENNITPKSFANTQLSTLSGYTGKMNTHVSALLSAQSGIVKAKQSVLDAKRSVEESQGALRDLLAGADEIDLASSRLTVKQRENALADAKENLANTYIRAPFAGTIAAIHVSKLDEISGGTAVATLITNKKVAKITLNELDVAKVKIGQPATITFDALEDLALTGKVIEVDAVGTVTQGVVSYAVTIELDADDERVKPGMSVSASIVVDVKQDVLAVPVSAVKQSGNTSYVEVFETPLDTSNGSQNIVSLVAPIRRTVTTGAANDTLIEIVSGIDVGVQVVTRTTTASTQTTASASRAPSLFGGTGVRMMR